MHARMHTRTRTRIHTHIHTDVIPLDQHARTHTHIHIRNAIGSTVSRLDEAIKKSKKNVEINNSTPQSSKRLCHHIAVHSGNKRAMTSAIILME